LEREEKGFEREREKKIEKIEINRVQHQNLEYQAHKHAVTITRKNSLLLSVFKIMYFYDINISVHNVIKYN